MDRPYIFCHMLTSLDGKIMGNYMDAPECGPASEVFYEIAFGKGRTYQHQGWLSGRVTTEDNFTFNRKPDLDEGAESAPEGDFAAKQTDMYYVSIDPSGKLGWDSDTLTYEDTTAHVLEVLTGRASNAYKAFLRKLGVSYIIAGEEELDYGLAMSKLKDMFGIETLMLGGGGVLNWSFIQAGMCDEVSVVIAPCADGSTETQTLFQVREGLSTDKAIGFTLKSADVLAGDAVWLRYLVKKEEHFAG